jgi:hypothetical protein
MSRNRAATLLISLLTVVGCKSETRIDGSSNAAFEESLKRVTEELDAAQQADFQAAVDYLAEARMKQSDIANSSGWDQMQFTQFMIEQMRKELHGFTASEIIDRAIEMRDREP